MPQRLLNREHLATISVSDSLSAASLAGIERSNAHAPSQPVRLASGDDARIVAYIKILVMAIIPTFLYLPMTSC